MVNETDVMTKVTSLKNYSVSKNATTEPLFVPLETAINNYFSSSANVSNDLREVIKYMYNDLYRRNTVYEYEFNNNLPTNYPTGYDDIRKCFYQFLQLLSISNETFYDGFTFIMSSGPNPTETATENSYINTWVTEINGAKSQDKTNLQTLSEWCKNSEGDSDIISILEDRGTIKSTITMHQIASIIYLDKKALEIINEKALFTYIPTYLRG